MSLAFVLDRRADLDPDGAAVADGRESFTNEQLLQRARAASRHLRDLGVRPGDVVALELTNRIELVVLLFAAWRLGAAVTPVDPLLNDGEVDLQLRDSGARLLVTEHSTSAHPGVPSLAVGALNQCLGFPDLASSPDPSAMALLLYTSGTTGSSTVVMVDHADVDAMAATGREALELDPGDHVNDIFASVLTPLLAGASIDLNRSNR